MEDLINIVGVDAKHSFEDQIDPVENFCSRYQDRICTIGGIDMDLIDTRQRRADQESYTKRARGLCLKQSLYIGNRKYGRKFYSYK